MKAVLYRTEKPGYENATRRYLCVAGHHVTEESYGGPDTCAVVKGENHGPCNGSSCREGQEVESEWWHSAEFVRKHHCFEFQANAWGFCATDYHNSPSLV